MFSFPKPKVSLDEAAAFFASFIRGDLPHMEARESEFFLGNLGGRVDQPVFMRERRYLRVFVVLSVTTRFLEEDPRLHATFDVAWEAFFDALMNRLRVDVQERRLSSDFMEMLYKKRLGAYWSALDGDSEFVHRRVTSMFTHYLLGEQGYSMDPRISVPCAVLLASDMESTASALKAGQIVFP